MEDHSGHRKRLIQKLGKGGLTEHEYLETLLFNALPRRNTNDIAHRLISRFGDVYGVLGASLSELVKVEGVGESAAAYIGCVGKFCEVYRPVTQTKGDWPDYFHLDTFPAYLKEAYKDVNYERLDVYLLNGENKIMVRKSFTRKDPNRVFAELEAISTFLVENHASGVVLTHNHPDANPLPSVEDDASSKLIQVLCSVHNTLLCDHLIYSPEGVFSYYRSGRLKEISERCDVGSFTQGK